MSRSGDPGHRELLRRYRGAGWRTRLHVWARWHTCPFAPLAAELEGARFVADVGCGHGLFSIFIAAAEPGRRVTGADIDTAKLAAAQRAAARGQPVEVDFIEGTRPPPGFDAAVIIDVLHLLPPADQEDLVRDLASALPPGGRILVKEMAPSPAWKARLIRVQERLATRVLRITATSAPGLAFTPPEDVARWLTAEGLEVRHRPLGQGHHVPHHLVVGRVRPGAVDPTRS